MGNTELQYKGALFSLQNPPSPKSSKYDKTNIGKFLFHGRLRLWPVICPKKKNLKFLAKKNK